MVPRKVRIFAAVAATLLVINLTVDPVSCKVGYRRTHPCKVVPLKARRVIKAQTIFTGVVKSVHASSGGHKFLSAKVRVKKVYRGDAARLEGQTVVVDGLGNPKICVSRCPVNGARIFFVMRSRTSGGGFPRYKLVSSLLRLTSANLKALTKIQQKRSGMYFKECTK